VIYGGVDYATGKLTYTVAGTKCGAVVSWCSWRPWSRLRGKEDPTGVRQRPVPCDQGGPEVAGRTSRADRGVLVTALLPSLNLIERLWGHLKRTVLANILYASLSELVAAFRKGVRRLTGNREHMGFMFNHDDLTRQLRRQHPQRAA